MKRTKLDKIFKPLLGWTQQKALVWHCPHSLPKYLDEQQVMVGTLSNLFASHVLSLRRLARSNSFTTAKSKMANTISNNRGTSHGGYTTSGPNKHWKNDNHAMLGGKEPANSTLMVIEFILKEVRSVIPEMETSGNQYVEKIAILMTYKDYVQTPHLEINHFICYSYIIHVPLCVSGSWMYVWERGDGWNGNKEMVHIPFGSLLVLRNDIWHGGVVGGKGNLTFHAAIIHKNDMTSTEQLVYDLPSGKASKTFEKLKVNYDEDTCFLPPTVMTSLLQMTKYLLEHLPFPPAYFNNLK